MDLFQKQIHKKLDFQEKIMFMDLFQKQIHKKLILKERNPPENNKKTKQFIVIEKNRISLIFIKKTWHRKKKK